jgi:hypothetical protein
MANATAIATLANYPEGIDNTQRRIHAYGTVQIGPTTAGTYVTGGLAFTLIGIKDKSGQVVILNTVSTKPLRCSFIDTSGTGYVFQYNAANATLQIFTIDTAATGTEYPMIEFTSGANIPASVVAAAIRFEADFQRANG